MSSSSRLSAWTTKISSRRAISSAKKPAQEACWRVLARALAVETDMSGETSDMNAHHALARWQEMGPITMRPGWSPRLTQVGIEFWLSNNLVVFLRRALRNVLVVCRTICLPTAAVPCSWFLSSRGRCHRSLAYPGRRCGSWELRLPWRRFRQTIRLRRRQRRLVSAFEYYAHCFVDSKPFSNIISALEAWPLGN